MTWMARSKPKAGEFDIGYEQGHGWFVIMPDGSTDERSFANRNAALSAKGAAAAKAAKRAKVIARPCMRCDREFESEGIHHRMCGHCRHVGSAEGEPVGHSFGVMNGRRR